MEADFLKAWHSFVNVAVNFPTEIPAFVRVRSQSLFLRAVNKG